MRILDKFISFIFSLAILVIAISVLVVTIGIEGVTSDTIIGILNTYVFAETYREIVILSSAVVILLALKVTLFSSCFKSKDTTPILVDTENGKIEIAQDTIDNTVKSVALSFSNIKDVHAKMLKKNDGIKIYAAISVLPEANIRELTKELQEKIIKVISETTGVKVLSANIKVKNIYEKVKKEVKTVELKVEEPKKVDVQEAVITEVEVSDIQDEQEKAE